MGKPLTMISSAYQMSEAGCCETPTSSGLPRRKIARRKIHCILPSSPWLADSKTNIPLGMLYIAAILRNDGHDVVVTSLLNKRYEGNVSLPDDVMDADVHMMGFCTPQFNEALELAAYIKDRAPKALVVAGGSHPSYEPKEVKEAVRQEVYHVKGVMSKRRDYSKGIDSRQLFDSVVIMEGELATLQLLSDWDAGELQPYYYGDKAEIPNLDVVPFPAWDLLPDDHIFNDGTAVLKERYKESPKRPGTWPCISMIFCRGCPFRCRYCSTPYIGVAPRYRSPQNVVAEIRKAVDLGIMQVKIQDDTQTLHRRKLRETAVAVEHEFGRDMLAMRIHTRVNTMDDEIAESLRMMSCKVTCFGIESGSQAVLNANEKGTTVAQNTQALKIARDNGFKTVSFLVAGLAGETMETAKQTLDWLADVRPNMDYCNLAVGIPYPGSKFWTNPHESGIEILDYNYSNQWIVGFSARDEILVRPYGCTVDEMFKVKEMMFKGLCDLKLAKAEWDEDVRIRHQQDDAVRAGVLPDAGAASVLTYAGH